MELSELVARYNQRLRVDDYEDAATNGLQVGPADREVQRAAFAVDAAVATVEEAVDWGADVL
ncbi:Nif3-like dinuclear metal center hexameric protein, partial [Halobacterium bonnevillei]